jgi:hypothetical protein
LSRAGISEPAYLGGIIILVVVGGENQSPVSDVPEIPLGGE